ncbi:FtsJ-like methyltransferase family protein [Canna indica]|uniref:Putative rRNA methyltransferase n=1 Tax=Canna indica TaxID=4628 RepID=A0AAQ3QM35_9LILI|nr:FtsJ-like methyltransferase family protein [Canna indica]
MGKVKGKQRQDKFYHLAKEQGYRSRAAFKLLQLDAKYRFLPSARSVLDLCAAPGGWLQVAVRHAPVGSFVVGVDLFPIRPVRGAHALVEDITTQKCRAAIKRLMDSNGCSAFNVVLHDGSPNVGGAWAQEATSQSALVVDSVRLATNFLAPKGTFVTKVFRSQDYSAIIYCLKQLFEKVEVTKPVASRSTSAEIYVIGLKYKAPAKIDPRLLDVKHLFQGAIEQPKVVDVLRGTKQKRNREGYEEGNTTLWKVGLVSDFIWSETPLEFLGSVNALSFDDPACLPIRDHELTTDEIKSLCEDLYVLDKNSFKHLLRWRMRVRKALTLTDKVAPKVNNDSKVNDAGDNVKDNEDDQLLNEMEELTHLLDRKQKKTKKLLSKRRAKDKARKAMGLQIDATEDSYFDKDLFSLSVIKGKKELLAIDSADLNDEYSKGDLVDSEDEETHRAKEDSSSDMDSDEEQKRYDEQLEEMLDQAYERYVTRTGGKTTQRKRAKKASSNGDIALVEGGDEDDDLVNPDGDSDKEQKEKESNPLMVPLDEDDQPTKEQLVERWFGQDVFAEAATDGMLEYSESEEEKEEKLVKVPEKPREQPMDTSVPNPKKQEQTATNDFEIVPAEPMETDDSSSSSDESEDMDNETKAEILAYAKKMLRKKQREQILDDAYNKYMFDDEGLPTWFAEEEKKHCQPMKPITKEEVAAMRAQFREIDARPAKKVAQAKARKKRIAMRRLEKVRHKANTISDQTDISERSKRKMIDQLYKKATPKKPQKEYVVAKKGVKMKVGKGKVLVDPRMKKDARSRGMGKAGKGGSKKGKGAKGKKVQKGKQFAKSNKGNKKRTQG